MTEGSIPGARLAALVKRLETHYDFQCEGGPLRNCVEWQELCALVRTSVPVRASGEPQK